MPQPINFARKVVEQPVESALVSVSEPLLELLVRWVLTVLFAPFGIPVARSLDDVDVQRRSGQQRTG